MKIYPLLNFLKQSKCYFFLHKEKTLLWVKEKIKYILNIYIFLITLLAIYLLFGEKIKNILQSYIIKCELLQLQEILRGAGTSFLAGTVVAFPFMISIAENSLGKWPYFIFKQIIEDRYLYTNFIWSIFLSFLLLIFSLIVDFSNFVIILFLTVGVIVLLLNSFKKSHDKFLNLIDPAEQIKRLSTQLGPIFSKIERIKNNFKRHFLLISNTNEESKPEEIAETIFAKEIPFNADRNLESAFIILRYYTLQGDTQLTKAVYQEIKEINKIYIKVKGSTFSPSLNLPGIEDNNLNDRLVNSTLKKLLYHLDVSIKTEDIEFITQNLEVIHQLTNEYLQVKYKQSLRGYQDTYAMLAQSCLCKGLEKLVMKGNLEGILRVIPLIANNTTIFLRDIEYIQNLDSIFTETINQFKSIISEKIKDDSYFLVIKEIVNQLSHLLYNVIINPNPGQYDPTQVQLEQLTEAIYEITTNILSEDSIIRPSGYLSPYYSYLSEGFLLKLTRIVNCITSGNTDDQKHIIYKIKCWVSHLTENRNSTIRVIIRESTAKSDGFFSSTLNWIVHLTKICLYLAEVEEQESQKNNTSNKFGRYAESLIDVLDYRINQNSEVTLRLLQLSQIEKEIGEIGKEAYRRKQIEVYHKCQSTLLVWCSKLSKKESKEKESPYISNFTYQYIILCSEDELSDSLKIANNIFAIYGKDEVLINALDEKFVNYHFIYENSKILNKFEEVIKNLKLLSKT